MSDIEFEIDGKTLRARPGQMVMEVADAAGIYIPRFCYHKHLSVAANCRMCLVEVEKSPKALPACATPATPGMKVFTRSTAALAAQKAVMEFLLINHPLDCPICDQGGECELQDLSLGFGADASSFCEGKRAVKDQDLGPLIATEMTRCIHCTRCVRFGDEIAGLREMGAVGRGENMEIRASLEQTLQSELSGNIIDLCPVGALTSKPFRFKARAWELSQYPSVSPHDCLGSNLNIHTRNGRVMRVVPRENPAINETWLSDRDRFSYEGLTHQDRLTRPLVRLAGRSWQETDWQTALDVAVRALRSVIDRRGADQLGALISPNATLEEHYLLQKLIRGLDCPNIDHRLRETSFEDQEEMDSYPGFQSTLTDIEQQDVILLIGSHPQQEQPLFATRLRKAVKRGARIVLLNMAEFRFSFDVDIERIVAPQDFLQVIAGLANLLLPENPPVPGLVPRESDQDIINLLRGGKKVGIHIGLQALHHPEAASLRRLVRRMATSLGACCNLLTEGANAAGAWLAGSVPHRGPKGQTLSRTGLDAAALWKNPRAGYLLCQVEPDLDCANGDLAIEALRMADCVVSLSCFAHPLLLETANVILPVTPFTETAGTFVNAMGEQQSFNGVALPPGEARPAWKVLRVLGNLLEVSGFDYSTAAEVLEEWRQLPAEASPKHSADDTRPVPVSFHPEGTRPPLTDSLRRIGVVPLYSADPLVRRARSLQAVQQKLDSFFLGVKMHPLTAIGLGLDSGDRVLIWQGKGRTVLPLRLDESVPRHALMVPAGVPETATLGELFGPIEIQKA